MTLLFNSVFWLGVSAIGCGILGAGSGFRVGWRAAEGGGLIADGGAGRWAMVLWSLGNFLIFPDFLRS